MRRSEFFCVIVFACTRKTGKVVGSLIICKGRHYQEMSVPQIIEGYLEGVVHESPVSTDQTFQREFSTHFQPNWYFRIFDTLRNVRGKQQLNDRCLFWEEKKLITNAWLKRICKRLPLTIDTHNSLDLFKSFITYEFPMSIDLVITMD